MQLHDLEKAKRTLEAQLQEMQTQLEEAQDREQVAVDEKSRLEVTLSAQKAEYERNLVAHDEGLEDAKKGLLRQIRELESDVEDERKQRSVAVNIRKKLEADLLESNQQLEFERKTKEEQSKQNKRMQVLHSDNTVSASRAV